MFNAEKLLGVMLRESMGLRGFGNRAAIGSGLLGLAFAAAEHFMNKSRPPFSDGDVPAGSTAAGTPPPSPGKTTPPPPPGAGVPPPPPPAENREQDALLLIRAMIASAGSDGQIDEAERQNVINRLESVNLSEGERDFIRKELASPCDLETIARQVNTQEQARQVYTVSLMAVDVDTDAERNYLDTLAERLGLEATVKDRIHEELGVSFKNR